MGTVLPNPFVKCVFEPENESYLVSMKHALLVMTGAEATCADCLYSGHACILVLMAYLWHMYTNNFFFKALAWTNAVVNCLLLIATRYHYTDDVILGVVITVALHTLYFWALSILYRIEDCSLDQRDSRYIPFFPFLTVVAWIEEIDISRIQKKETFNDEML